MERDRELRALAGLLEAARGGAGGGLLLEGTAGIGKSALLAAAGERARDGGMLVLGARGGELERVFGFGVVRQLFERALASVPGARQRSLLSGGARFAVPAIGHAVVSAGGEARAADPFSVMHGLYWLTVNLSAAHPVLVCVDDAHWADVPSLRWLAYLARRLEGARVALVVAARPAETDADSARYRSQPTAPTGSTPRTGGGHGPTSTRTSGGRCPRWRSSRALTGLAACACCKRISPAANGTGAGVICSRWMSSTSATGSRPRPSPRRPGSVRSAGRMSRPGGGRAGSPAGRARSRSGSGSLARCGRGRR